MLGEKSLLGRNDERRGVGERDETEFRTLHFRLGSGRESA